MMGLPLTDQKIEIVQTAEMASSTGLRVVLARVRGSHGPHGGGQDGGGDL